MSAVVVVGGQWGDEGKGKVTDALARDADVVVRYQGGNNAGHTVVVGDQEFRLHLIPSGIVWPGKLCLIGNGAVVDPAALIRELDELRARGVDTEGLRLSLRAHLIMPYHKRLEELEESKRGPARIGTTGRGIGPAYMDKAARVGIRVCDLLDADWFAALLRERLAEKNDLLERVYGAAGFDYDGLLRDYLGYAARIAPYVADTSLLINESIDRGRRVLFEGAQGTLLDVDHGTYPYVTSSHPVAGGACIGAGVGPTRITRVIGVMKAYVTRVGEGPFPTELPGGEGEFLRRRGREYGTTTGRPRRCGWFDAVAARYAVSVGGLNTLAVTKLDILSGLEKVRLCVAYRHRGKILDRFPADSRVLALCEPVYEELDGWKEEIRGARRVDDLPPPARKCLARLEQLCGARVSVVSVGSARDETITIETPY